MHESESHQKINFFTELYISIKNDSCSDKVTKYLDYIYAHVQAKEHCDIIFFVRFVLIIVGTPELQEPRNPSFS